MFISNTMGSILIGGNNFQLIKNDVFTLVTASISTYMNGQQMKIIRVSICELGQHVLFALVEYEI